MYDDTVTVDKAYYNKLKEQTTWVSVKDRLPEKYTDVIVLYDIGRVGVNWVNKENEFEEYAYCKVTHWMPLPSTEGLHDENT